MYEDIRVPPPPSFLLQVFPLFWFYLYLVKTYLLWYNFLVTDNNDVISQTANCDFLGCSIRLVRIPFHNLPQAGLNLVAPQIFNQCDIDA